MSPDGWTFFVDDAGGITITSPDGKSRPVPPSAANFLSWGPPGVAFVTTDLPSGAIQLSRVDLATLATKPVAEIMVADRTGLASCFLSSAIEVNGKIGYAYQTIREQWKIVVVSGAGR
jgi:hypothetical protein